MRICLRTIHRSVHLFNVVGSRCFCFTPWLMGMIWKQWAGSAPVGVSAEVVSFLRCEEIVKPHILGHRDVLTGNRVGDMEKLPRLWEIALVEHFSVLGQCLWGEELRVRLSTPGARPTRGSSPARPTFLSSFPDLAFQISVEKVLGMTICS